MQVIYSEKHALHDPVRAFANGMELQHVESPARAERILEAAETAGHDIVSARSYGPGVLESVHAAELVAYLRGAYEPWVEAGMSPDGVIPSTFPRRPPREASRAVKGRAGRFCFDTETPIGARTFEAAFASAACALTGADLLAGGARAAYALCRPPGHHAGPDYFGGYCYVNNAALAAEWLRTGGGEPVRVAVLDLDYHHGNGTQEIFYESGDVLYVSVHADPRAAYPYYWGFADERGAGAGEGRNLNLLLPENTAEDDYRSVLGDALKAVGEFRPEYLVVSLGTDTAGEDRLGSFGLSVESFRRLGRRVAGAGLPILVVQEGGYNLETIGPCVTEFLAGLEGQ
ncbi:MAG: histone deacetylase family protein [Candidatus Brocadiia bacterium]